MRISTARAFTLIELVIALAIAAMLVAVVMPATGLMRTESRLAGSRDNLGQIGKAGGQYSAANDNLIPGYDWPGGPVPGGSAFDLYEYDIGGGDTERAVDHLHAAQLQQAAIIRKTTGRFFGPDRIDVNDLRVPHRRFGLLPLIDWLGGTLPDPISVSPLDIHHQEFQQHPLDYDALPGGIPEYVAASDTNWTRQQVVMQWPYASSYQTTIYSWSPSRPNEYGELPAHPADNATLMIMAPDTLAQQNITTVVFPSHKAFLFEEFDYSQGLGNQGLYYADPAANINVLFFDGSARNIATEDANPGWDANEPCDMSRTAELRYESIDTRYFRDYADYVDPDGNPWHAGYYKWTRGGLYGVDVGGGEINTTDWCP